MVGGLTIGSELTRWMRETRNNQDESCGPIIFVMNKILAVLRAVKLKPRRIARSNELSKNFVFAQSNLEQFCCVFYSLDYIKIGRGERSFEV